MTPVEQFSQALIQETKRRLFEESVPRLKKCLTELSNEEIWSRPNENSNSMGNLVLHLCGNVRQWILSGLGKQLDQRKRQQEFDTLTSIPTEVLIKMVDDLMLEVAIVLNNTTSEMLLKKHPVQVYEESGLSILVHVVEHFSYHVGQMTYFVKWHKNVNMEYYTEDLEIH